MIESLCLYLHCLSAALLCYIGFQNQSLIRSTSCSCSTCCFGLGFQLQNLQDFIKISRALIKDIFLTFLTCLSTPNLIRNARRGRGEDFLSIDGQFSIAVKGFTMQVLGTCDVAHHLLPIAVGIATSERKAVTAPILKAVHEEVQKDGSPWCPTKGMADHAGAFRDVLAAEFTGMMVADCYFHVAMIVRDKATLLGSFYPAVMATVREMANLPSPQVHHDKKGEAITEWVSQGVPEKFTEAFRKEYLGKSWCIATLPAGYPTTNNHQEGINSSVKGIWTRHERRCLIPFLKWVKRMLHNWSKDRTTHVAGLYPNTQ